MECDQQDCHNEATVHKIQRNPQGGYVYHICDKCDDALDDYWDKKVSARRDGE